MELLQLINTSNDYFQIVSSQGIITSLLGGRIHLSLNEIAFALANTNRFQGHLGQYSIAQHSCLVSDLMGGSYNGLMHDGHEVICGDVSTPVKNALNLLGNGVWREFEHAIAKRFRYHWGVANPLPPQVKEADKQALRIEVASLANNKAKTSYVKAGIEPLYGSPHHIHEVWSPDKAFDEFNKRFNLLGPTGRKK